MAAAVASLLVPLCVSLASAAGPAPSRPGESSPLAAFEAAASRTRGDGFVVLHPVDLQPEAAAALRTLGEGRTLIRDGLGLTVDGTITVLLLPPGAFRDGTGNPPWVRGTYDGRILVPVAPGAAAAGSSALDAVLMHELTHALLRAPGSAALPPWFEEGLAERFEGTSPEAAAAWLRRRRAPRFAGLGAIDDAIRAGGWREDAGHQGARLAVQSLEDLGGPGATAGIIAAARAGTAFAAALPVFVPGGAAAIEEALRRRLPGAIDN